MQPIRTLSFMSAQLHQRILSSSFATSSGRASCFGQTAAIFLRSRQPQRHSVCAVADGAIKERQVSTSDIQEIKELIDVNPPKGTRDFGPEEHRMKQWLFGHFEAVSRLFGFEQFETPVLESEELFVRKAGEEITQQLYNFEDKGQRRVALRPELTPSLARLILSKGNSLSLPAKWFTIGQCWRYERTTRGRRREHYQWNMDIVGVPEITAEAELLSAIVMFLENVGLTSQDVTIKVSSRKVLQAILEQYNVPIDKFSSVCIVVDKLDKMPREKVTQELTDLGLNQSAINGILSLTEIESVEHLEQLLGADNEAVHEIKSLFALADSAGCSSYLEFDPSVVRGLAYYTGIVFEGRDTAGQLRAIFGGGRYDKLLATLGGEPQPCAGFGFGDCVIQELLQEKGLTPDLKHQVDCIVVAMNGDLQEQAVRVARVLRGKGQSVDLVLQKKKMKQVFKQAERCGASHMYLIAPDEWEEGLIRVKDLAAREETDVPAKELLS